MTVLRVLTSNYRQSGGSKTSMMVKLENWWKSSPHIEILASNSLHLTCVEGYERSVEGLCKSVPALLT